MQFKDARVWLTGASSGIGEALIAPLVDRGARLAISARRADRLETLAADARAPGADVRAYPWTSPIVQRSRGPSPRSKRISAASIWRS